MSDNTGEQYRPDQQKKSEPDKTDSFDKYLLAWKKKLIEDDFYSPIKMEQLALEFTADKQLSEDLTSQQVEIFDFGAIFFTTNLKMAPLYRDIESIKRKRLDKHEEEKLTGEIRKKIKNLSVDVQQNAVEMLVLDQRDEEGNLDLKNAADFMMVLEGILHQFKQDIDDKGGGPYGMFRGIRGNLGAAILAEETGLRIKLPSKDLDLYYNVDLEFETPEMVSGTIQAKSIKRDPAGNDLGFEVSEIQLSRDINHEYRKKNKVNVLVNIPNIDLESEGDAQYSTLAGRAIGIPSRESIEKFKKVIQKIGWGRGVEIF